MNKKSQTMSFIIVLLISVLAIAGVFIGTYQGWRSMACAMGVPMRTSFSTHIGNLGQPTFNIDVNYNPITYDGTYAECITFCIGKPPADCTPPTSSLCINKALQACPQNTTCYKFSTTITYNGAPATSGNITVSVKEKPRLGLSELSNYGEPVYQEDKGVFESNTEAEFTTTFSKPYILLNDIIPDPYNPIAGIPFYTCTNGSYLLVTVSNGIKEETLEKEYEHFCILPKISFGKDNLGHPVVITDKVSICQYAQTSAVGIYPNPTNPLIYTNTTDSRTHIIDNHVMTNFYYILCKETINGIVYSESWLDAWAVLT